ncbi:MAG: dihydrodipicolinate synthase family protein [Chloroflexota bacterium]
MAPTLAKPLANLEGIIPPIITPLRPDESLDRAGLERLIEYGLKGGISGVFLLGSCGEGPAIREDVREELVAAASERCRGRAAVLVGISAVGTQQTVALAKRLTKRGGDAIVVVSPYYFSHTQAEMAAHITAVAGSVDVPTLIYNIPQMVKTSIDPETVALMAERPEIVGIKDSQGDMSRFQEILAVKARRPDFLVFQGAEGVAALSVVRGANGGVLGSANVAPSLCHEMFLAAKNGELTRAWELQQRLVALSHLYTHGQWLPCLKMAASMLGLCGSTASAPFARLGESAIEGIRADLRAAGLL